MVNISLSAPSNPTIIQSLPFQLGIIAVGIFLLTAFGSVIVTENPVFSIIGLKVSFFDLFIVFLVFIILLILR